jgi:pilus assembly protein Flp/PilA
MTKLWNAALTLKIWKDTHGQDLVEYALGTGLIAAAAVAVSPQLASSIETVFGNVVSALQAAGGGGGGTASPTA